MGELTLAMGAISDPIAKQIEAAGLNVPMDLPRLQLAADAISRLFVCGYITNSMADSARKKLMKDIVKAVEKANGNDGDE